MAVQVADDLGELFDDGLAYVELAHVPDQSGVSLAIGSVLSLREVAEHVMADRLAAHLQNKHLLLVLDNFEHVVAAAALVARLLHAAPRLKVLVTSRTALRLRGEHAVVVSPLALPGVSHAGTEDVADLLRYPAVALFVERSQAAGSRLTLDLQTLLTVVEICRRLDGLPLAIELAAARSNVLPPRALLAHLDIRLPVLTGGARDAPTRQRTMRDAIGWSYALLDPDQQTAFRWLAVCIGGCTLAAAEAVLGDRYRQSDVSPLDVVAALVDQSLLNATEDVDGEPRLRMLEVVREYGLEHLAGDADAGAARERHARHFLELAEAAAPHLMGSSQQSIWLDRLEREHGNLVAALTWAWRGGQVELGLRLVNALGPFWYFRGFFSEGRLWVDRYLATSSRLEHASAARLWLLYGAGKIALEQGDDARVGEVAAEARALASAHDDALGLAQALELLGGLARRRGDPLGARALLEEALVQARRANDGGQIERVLYGLGHAARESGDLSRAEIAFEELLVESRRAGPTHGEARLLASLGQVAGALGDDERAGDRYREALGVFEPIGDPPGVASCLEGLAGIARRRGDLERAVRLYGAAARLRESAASALPVFERGNVDAAAADLTIAIGEEGFAAAWAAGQGLSAERAVAYAIE
jgi:predicted ATPase